VNFVEFVNPASQQWEKSSAGLLVMSTLRVWGIVGQNHRSWWPRQSEEPTRTTRIKHPCKAAHQATRRGSTRQREENESRAAGIWQADQMGAYASGDQGEHRAVPSYLLAGPVTTEEGAPSRRSPSTPSQEERSDPVRRCPCGCGDVLYSAEANIGTGTLVFF
jgi:hypothetical protein